MSILGWIILGWLAGWIASLLLNKRQGCVMNVIVGIIGAVVGGAVFSFLGHSSVMTLNLYSLIVAVVGAVILLAIINIGRRP